MNKNIFGIDIPYYVFETEKLAGEGLYFGGEVDDNGNIFREKDVLENDYSCPLLESGKYFVCSKLYVSLSEPKDRHYQICSDGQYSPRFSLLLTVEESELAVREPNHEEYVELIVKALNEINIADDVYRYMKKKYVLQDATDYIVENNYDNELPDDEAEIKKIGELADEVATRYVYWGKNDANRIYWDNIKSIYDRVIVERNRHDRHD